MIYDNQPANNFTNFTGSSFPPIIPEGGNNDSIKPRKSISKKITIIFFMVAILIALPIIIMTLPIFQVVVGYFYLHYDQNQYPDPDKEPKVIMYLQRYGNANVGPLWILSKGMAPVGIWEKEKHVFGRWILDTKPNKLYIWLHYKTKKETDTAVYKYDISLTADTDYESNQNSDTHWNNLFEFVFEQNKTTIKKLLDKHPNYSYDEEKKTVTLPLDYQTSEVEALFKDLLELPYYNMLYSVCYNSPIDQEYTSNSFYDNVCEDALPKIDFGLEGRANQLFANMKDKKIEPLSSRLEVNE